MPAVLCGKCRNCIDDPLAASGADGTLDIYEDPGMRLAEADAEGVTVVEAHGRLDNTTVQGIR